jgi:outer membrane protein TolC
MCLKRKKKILRGQIEEETKLKKKFLSFLIMTVTLANISLVNISSVQAATTDNTIETSADGTIKVSLENIRDIMIENNLDIKIQQNSLKIANEEYHDAKDAYDSANTAYEDASKAYDDAVAANDGTAADKLEKKNDAKKALDDKDKALTTKRDANKTASTTYDQKVETKVNAAQNDFIDYLATLSNVKLQEDTVKANEKKAQKYKLQYENGFLSKNEYTSNLAKNTSANSLNELKDKEELARIKLCNTLGLSSEEKVTFNTDITEDFKVISNINYDDDLAKMLENNIDIKDKNDEIDDLKDNEDTYTNDDIYDNNLEKANNELKVLMNNAETDFKGQYNTLMNSYNSIKSTYDQLTEEENSYNVKKIKYDYGFVSKTELDDAKLTLDTDESALQTKKNTLYVNYLNYLQAKEGY